MQIRAKTFFLVTSVALGSSTLVECLEQLSKQDSSNRERSALCLTKPILQSYVVNIAIDKIASFDIDKHWSWKSKVLNSEQSS